MKKGQSISLNTIVVAAIALIVMIIVILIFTQNSQNFANNARNCENNGGYCVSDVATCQAQNGIVRGNLNQWCVENRDPDVICCSSAEGNTP